MVGIDIEAAIKQFARIKRVKPEEFQAFHDKILAGLNKLGLGTDKIDMKKYKEVAHGNANQDMHLSPQGREGNTEGSSSNSRKWGSDSSFASFGQAWGLVVGERKKPLQ